MSEQARPFLTPGAWNGFPAWRTCGVVEGITGIHRNMQWLSQKEAVRQFWNLKSFRVQATIEATSEDLNRTGGWEINLVINKQEQIYWPYVLDTTPGAEPVERIFSSPLPEYKLMGYTYIPSGLEGIEVYGEGAGHLNFHAGFNVGGARVWFNPMTGLLNPGFAFDGAFEFVNEFQILLGLYEEIDPGDPSFRTFDYIASVFGEPIFCVGYISGFGYDISDKDISAWASVTISEPVWWEYEQEEVEWLSGF